MTEIEEFYKRVTYCQVQICAAGIEAMAMQSENDKIKFIGAGCPVYTHGDFIKLIDKYGLGHNSILTSINGY